ncbi:MAG TPA: GTP-binding protein [Patescibacteria group bacterium]|nr:GTP-binding protein [Patescibacteria group bacterium]
MDKIRNFAIVAHIDHGKSTLADRLLELTKTVQASQMKEQFLDQNPISRERGITIKLAPVRMNYILNSELYILNLIDTPGHIDFSYEVSRTLACCEGVVLLVDATQGVQAQTVAHFQTAREQNLAIIPVINKIDMDIAKVEETENQMVELFGFNREEILKISAKTGQGVKELLDRVILKIPAPKSSMENIFRALVFDAVYDDHRGVVAFVRVFDGKVKRQERIQFFQSDGRPIVSEVGYFSPNLIPKEDLTTGEIGYVVTGVKDIRLVRVGDTITTQGSKTTPLPGYKNPVPMVFFGVYPKSSSDFGRLKEALNKLSLNDASLTIDSEYSSFLGSGFRVGFLGLLHAEIVKERIKQESGIDPLLTRPQVLYKKEGDKTLEPYMKLTIYAPKDYVGPLMNICEKKRGNLINIIYQDRNAILYYDMPYSCLLANLTSDIKSISSGFASIDYEITGYKEADLVNLEIFVNDISIDVLSETVYKDEANAVARDKTEKLKELLPRQQYRQIIQAKVTGKILARTEISPFRKDVLAKMSGGDRTRKDKLLKKQKKGKERMQSQAKIDIPQKALFDLLES